MLAWIAVAAAAPCTRSFLDDAAMSAAPVGTPTTVAAYVRDRPATGRLSFEATIRDAHACAPCPADATCKPCEATVTAADGDAAVTVHVHDAKRFEVGRRYWLTLEVCPVTSIAVPPPPADLELRGYTPVLPP
jgi:hypothetical protein